MTNIKNEQLNYQMTEKLLKRISNRTSGRKDFNHLEYEVTITKDKNITFSPTRCVYKNNKNAVKYTTDNMIVAILSELNNFNDFVPGTYRYVYYTDDKSRRHWIKKEDHDENQISNN